MIAGSYKLQGSPITEGFMLMLSPDGQPVVNFGENGYLKVLADDGDLNTFDDITLSDDDHILVVGNTRGNLIGFLSIYDLQGVRQEYYSLDADNFNPTAVLSYEDKIILSGQIDQSLSFSVACFDPNQTSGGGEITAIEEPAYFGKTVYPNPAQSNLNISNLKQYNATYQIIDLAGKKWNTRFLSYEKNGLDISHLPNGLYLLKVSDRTSSRSFTFIKN